MKDLREAMKKNMSEGDTYSSVELTQKKLCRKVSGKLKSLRSNEFKDVTFSKFLCMDDEGSLARSQLSQIVEI